jgi:hypothetical protein
LRQLLTEWTLGAHAFSKGYILFYNCILPLIAKMLLIANPLVIDKLVITKLVIAKLAEPGAGRNGVGSL